MGTAATSDGNNLVMALMVKRSRGLRRGWGAALWRRMTSCLSKVFSATSAARERSVSRSVASTAFVTSRSIRKEYPAVCSRPGYLRHEHRQDPRHFQVRSEYLRRTTVGHQLTDPVLAGLTTTEGSASAQRDQRWKSTTQKARSLLRRRGRAEVRWKLASC
jgi:hypothetical protein